MKSVFSMALLLSLSFGASAQRQNPQNSIADSVRNTHMHVRPKPGPMTITGIVLASTGPIVSGIGLATLIHENRKVYSPQQPTRNNGPVIIGVGASMVAAGVTLIIIGAIHDHKKARTSFSFVAPRNNEMGIAFNF